MAQATINDTGEQLISKVNTALALAQPRLRVMSYNVAQLTNNNPSGNNNIDANGYYINGRITSQGTYDERNAAWRKLMNGISPDVLVSIEDNDVFATIDGVKKYSVETIFSQMPYRIADGTYYSAKALYNRFGEPTDVVKKAYAANGNNRYITATIKVAGVDVKIAIIHLDISPNDGTQATITEQRRQEMLELINNFANAPYAIIAGDFNILSADEYELFTQYGYKCANHGFMGDLTTYTQTLVVPTGSRALDNIIAKGFDISNIHVEDAAIYRDINGVSTRYPLSDHNPIWCDLLMKL